MPSCLSYVPYQLITLSCLFSDLDEREKYEEIPEYKVKMRGCRVMSINYSFLWQYLEPSRLLPILVDKEFMTEAGKHEAESYAQKSAQNPMIINELFASHCSPLKLCDTLDVTGQEHIARKLRQGTYCVGCILIRACLSKPHTDGLNESCV